VITARRGGGDRWVAAQRDLAHLLGGRQTVLPESRHLVMMDEPQAIADAVWRVLDTVRRVD
jgi:hypothetical protein